MTHQELIKNGLNDWALYFRRKLTDKVAVMYLEKISPYSTKTVEYLFSAVLEQEEKWPSLKFVINWLQRSGETIKEYDTEEDQNYPIDNLWTAYGILVKRGEDAFYDYCNKNNMPLNDRARVLAKKKYNYNVNDLLSEGE